jgi:methionine salvage enolase-phosphatase E1
MKNITIWKTVTIGLHTDVASYREALEKLGITPNEAVMQMMDTVSVAKTEENIDLVMVTVSELGLEKSMGLCTTMCAMLH